MPDDESGPDSVTMHASAVSIDGNGVLIYGKSGSGKSSLALELMAFGGLLISDDQVKLTAYNGKLVASAPKSILGKIEARGIGILAARPTSATNIALCVDMDKSETQRLPDLHEVQLEGVSLPLVFGRENRHLAVAILQYLKTIRAD